MKRKLIIFLLVLFSAAVARTQKAKELFQSDEILEFTMTMDMKKVYGDVEERDYHPVNISLVTPDGTITELKSRAKEMLARDFLGKLEAIGNAERKSYGWVLDMDVTHSLLGAGHPKTLSLIHFLNLMYTVQHPHTVRRGHAEIVRLVRQLKRLGFEVNR